MWHCDGEYDCTDGSDEWHCSSTNIHNQNATSAGCRRSQWQCANGAECISALWLCDGSADCADGSDEMPSLCGPEATTTTCTPPEQFRCESGKCIPQRWVCDGVPHCGTDEAGCGPADGGFDASPTSESESGSDDDEDDDLDLDEDDSDSDEFGAGAEDETTAARNCGEDYFHCKNGQCFRVETFCDGTRDCADGTDEYDGCEGMRVSMLSGNWCTSAEFHCANGRCVPAEAQCNLIDDCGDRSDERPELCVNSTQLCAGPNFYRCGEWSFFLNFFFIYIC